MPKKAKKTTFTQKLKTHPKLMILISVLVFAAIGVAVLGFSKAAVYDSIPDISSPQCGNNSIVSGRTQYGIVGLNGTYMNFGTNKCVVEQAKLFGTYDLYVGANYPSGHCTGISAADCGVKAGEYNLNLMRLLGLRPSRLWIDVETGPNIKWSTNTNDNNAFIFSMYVTMLREYKTIGYYSNAGMWQQITGGANLGGSSNWYATGRVNPTDALTYCTKQFGGVGTQYVQYIENGRLDINMSCYLNNKNPTPAPNPTPVPPTTTNPAPAK